MRFSVLQQKEVIEAGNGRFLGYVVDAEVAKDTGHLTAFMIAEPKKYLGLFSSEEAILKVAMQDVLVVGKDVILVRSLS
ncbi:MAG: YlmC/YmxH family sporulation protein [Lysinibacillus sp.]